MGRECLDGALKLDRLHNRDRILGHRAQFPICAPSPVWGRLEIGYSAERLGSTDMAAGAPRVMRKTIATEGSHGNH